MDVFAYAKLNLALKVAGRRADGYHELDMVMQEISLRDEISIQKSGTLTVESDKPLPPDNTLIKAARVFFEYTRVRGGADIRVQKNIPAQAGLGGGSSDAAAVLKALNSLYGAGLQTEELISLGRQVGADVPFFIAGGCARARGTGEILAPLANNLRVVFLLAKPAGGVNTIEAYEAYHRLQKSETDIGGVIAALKAGDIGRYAKAAANDLAPAAMHLCPDIENILSQIRDAACALVTGSGSCVFGAYANKTAALIEQERLKEYPFIDFIYVAESR
jgi:4-diphosphocytidyl-2-C-methyl-D-erythritol kinase